MRLIRQSIDECAGLQVECAAELDEGDDIKAIIINFSDNTCLIISGGYDERGPVSPRIEGAMDPKPWCELTTQGRVKAGLLTQEEADTQRAEYESAKAIEEAQYEKAQEEKERLLYEHLKLKFAAR